MNYNYTDINKQAAELYGEEYIENDVNSHNKVKTSKKKLFILLSIVFVLVAVITSIVIVIINRKPYEKPIKEQFNLVKKCNFNYFSYDKYVSPTCICENNLTLQKFGIIDYSDISTIFEDNYNVLQKTYGEDFNISYEILSAKRQNSSQVKKLENELFEYTNMYGIEDEEYYKNTQREFDLSYEEIEELKKADKKFYDEIHDLEIKDAYLVKLVVIITGSESDYSFIDEVYSMNVGDKWILDKVIQPQYFLQNRY